MKAIKMFLYKAFVLVVKPFIGTGISRFLPVGTIFRYVAGTVIPAEKRLISINDYKMFVHTEKYKGIDGIAQELLFTGTHEPYTTVLFKQLVRRGMTVIDLGAQIGYFTLLAASLVGEKGRVFAFEPEPRNYALLVKNIEVNAFKNVIPLQKAVSYKTGKVNLFLSKADSSGHSLFKAKVARRMETLAESIMVDVVSLDEFFNDNGCPIDVIKMDVEGAEMTVLLGMAKILEGNDNPKIFTEFNPAALQKSGVPPEEYWNKLMQFGFKFIYLIMEREQKLELVDFEDVIEYLRTPVFKRLPKYVNLLCSKSALEILNG